MGSCLKLIVWALLTMCLLVSSPVRAEGNAQEETSKAGKMEWWKDAKFGMFIHWGVYSVPAGTYDGHRIGRVGEWIMNRGKIPMVEYRKFAAEFNPVNYDPEAWVRMAADAGMRYIVITSKHHDGFALFDSAVTDWDIVDAAPYGKDLLAPLVKACRAQGMRIGFYYSQAQDWNHPGGAAARRLTKEGWDNPDADRIDAYTKAHNGHWDPAQEGDMDEYIDKIAIPQVKEILTKYGPVDILWWDTPTGMTEERSARFAEIIKDYPTLITNNRLGRKFGGDLETPEQFIPATGYPGRNWEVCMTMNNTWGYKSYDNNWKSGEELLLKLSEIVSKGGNFLLNVGPTSLGEFPEASVKRLKFIGDWMKLNHEAVYGTRASPFPYLPFGRATMKSGKLYLHVYDWPAGRGLRLPLKNKVIRTYLLADPERTLSVVPTDTGIEIATPVNAPDPVISIVVVEFEGEVKALPIPTIGRKGSASSTAGGTSVDNLFDGRPKNKWMAEKGETSAWIEVDLGEEIRVENMILVEKGRHHGDFSQPFELLVKKDGEWKRLLKGKTSGNGFSGRFPPAKGRVFRLNITGANGAEPILEEWMLNRAI